MNYEKIDGGAQELTLKERKKPEFASKHVKIICKIMYV